MATPNCCGCEARKRSRLPPQSARRLRSLIHLHSLTRGNDSAQTCTDRLIDGPGPAIAGFRLGLDLCPSCHRLVRYTRKRSIDTLSQQTLLFRHLVHSQSKAILISVYSVLNQSKMRRTMSMSDLQRISILKKTYRRDKNFS